MRNLNSRAAALALLAGAAGLPLWTQVLAQQAVDEPAAAEPAPQEAPESPPAAPAETSAREATGDQKAGAQALLEKSCETLVNLRSIKTRMLETVAIGDQQFKAVGSYLQGSDLKLRLELSIRLGTMEGSLLEVCDGSVLWTSRRVGDVARITRRNVREISQAASAVELNEATLIEAELGLGGLPALLASIRKSMAFDTLETQDINGETFRVIEGTWNDEMKAKFAANPTTAERLPDHVPDRIRIYFDASDLPRRIVYLKTAESGAPRPLVTIDFEDMVINPPISDGEFTYVPPDDVPKTDVTHQYIERLKAAGKAK